MSDSSSGLYDISGIRLPVDACVVIVRTEWNAVTVDKLEEGCNRILEQNKIRYKTLVVPGAFEIPFAIRKFWETNLNNMERPNAFIALGCVLRGGTPHFENICQAVTNGILQLNMSLPVPTIFGILTVNDQQQADDRTGGKHGHKGEEAAVTAIKLIALQEKL